MSQESRKFDGIVNGASDMLDRLLDQLVLTLNTEAAQKLVDLKADAELQARIEYLAGQCNEGKLTTDEKSEYERYVIWGNLIAILQAKARGRLAKG
jgi:hypothetical protein